MTQVTKEEVKKLAEMTRLSFREDELDGIVKQLNSLLSYAECVVQVAGEQAQDTSTKNDNVVRLDQVVKTDSAPILAQAPVHEDNYFVVPKILDN